VELERSVVLVVDDDISTRELVGSILGGRNEVLQAEGISAGLRHLESGRVDLVLLDVMMPDMVGYEGCRLIKAHATARGEYLPVVLLTALKTQEARNRGLEAGADDFLSKPIDRTELVLRVQTFLRLRWHERVLQHQILAMRAGDALKDDLVSLLVHDARNPLSGITGVLEGMTGSTIDEGWREEVDLAVIAGAEVREILEDILHVKRFESGALEIIREPVEVNLMVASAVASMGGAARARTVHIVRVPGPTAPTVSADRKLFRRALENLLSNAIRYSPPGGEVRVVVKESAGLVEIEVIDSGIGVPDVFKKELFKKFGSVEAASGGVRRGFGLGLYMVDLVARAHGGKATVRDRGGGGTIFGIAVPRGS
jgi:signal transduction histidine kinase